MIIVGQDGLRSALKQHNFELTTIPSEAAYAVGGINFELTYEELAGVALAIRNGAKFIGTNSDPSYPSERGLLPGAGSILALLATATGVGPVPVCTAIGLCSVCITLRLLTTVDMACLKISCSWLLFSRSTEYLSNDRIFPVSFTPLTR